MEFKIDFTEKKKTVECNQAGSTRLVSDGEDNTKWTQKELLVL